MAASNTSRGRKGAVSKKTRAGSERRKKAPVRMLAHARVAAAVEAMAAPAGTARFGAGKALAVTAEKDPARVYPHFDTIAALLDGESKVVRWNALQILGALAPVDAERRLDDVLDRYLGFIQCGNLISAANAIQGAARIANARPELRERIIPALLAVEQAAYETVECRNVAIGQVLTALEAGWAQISARADVQAFVIRQRANLRAAVARQAARMASWFVV